MKPIEVEEREVPATTTSELQTKIYTTHPERGDAQHMIGGALTMK